MVDSYKLMLLPAWVGEVVSGDARIPFYMNAENGELKPQKANRESVSWWKKLFNDS
jgi:hypothetical protein